LSERSPVTCTALILFALLVALLSVIVISLNRQAERGYRDQISAQLATTARVAASKLEAERGELRARAGALAASQRLQRAVAAGDLPQLARIARDEQARIDVAGQTTDALPSGLRFLSTATLVSPTHTLTRVTVAVRLDDATIRNVESTTTHPRQGRLIIVSRGRVAAGGTTAPTAVHDDRLDLGASHYFAASAPLTVAGAAVYAIAPTTIVSARIAGYRNHTLLAALLTLFVITALSVTLARPLERFVVELGERATRDPVTDLANRRLLDERLREELDRARRYHTHLALVLIDIDDFKQVNDRYGHQCGDDVLRAVGAALAASVRELDLAGRFGGEEFALVLPGTSAIGARRVAELTRRAISEIEVMGPRGESVRITASLGAAEFPTCGTLAELVEHADRCVYEAKRNGKDQVVGSVTSLAATS
jgi:diguanylate cyclase (GGDEF)-like protein